MNARNKTVIRWKEKLMEGVKKIQIYNNQRWKENQNKKKKTSNQI